MKRSPFLELHSTAQLVARILQLEAAIRRVKKHLNVGEYSHASAILSNAVQI